MARTYARDSHGKFASGGTVKARRTKTSQAPAKPERSTAKKVAIATGIAVGVAVATGGLKVRGDALARYDARTAAALLRASDATSSWP